MASINDRIPLTLIEKAEAPLRVVTTKVEIDFAGNGSYVDITSFVRDISVTNDLEGQDFMTSVASVANISVNNVTGDFSPSNVNGAYYPNLKPNRKVRIYAGFDHQNVLLFEGYVDRYSPKASGKTCNIKCRGLAKPLIETDAPDITLLNVSVDEAVKSLLDQANIPYVTHKTTLMSGAVFWNACTLDNAHIEGENVLLDTPPDMWFETHASFTGSIITPALDMEVPSAEIDLISTLTFPENTTGQLYVRFSFDGVNWSDWSSAYQANARKRIQGATLRYCQIRVDLTTTTYTDIPSLTSLTTERKGSIMRTVTRIPVFNPSGAKYWERINQLAQAVDGRLYFENGYAHFYSKMSPDYVLKNESLYRFTASNLFSLDQEIDDSRVRNEVRVSSNYVDILPLQVIWQTPQFEARVTNEQYIADGTAFIQLKTRKPDGSEVLTENIPLKDTESITVLDLTAGKTFTVDPATTDLNTGKIGLTEPTTSGNIMMVDYTYKQLVLLPGKQRTFKGVFDKAIDILPPDLAANDDYGNSLEISTVPDVQNTVSIQSYIYGSQGSEIVVKNNYPDVEAVISTLQIRGKPLKSVNPIIHVKVDTESQDIYGIKSLEIKNDYITSEDQARRLTDYLVFTLKDAKSVLKCEARGLPHLYLGDRVTITETNTGIDFDFIVIGITHRIRQSGWKMEIDLLEADAIQWNYT